MIVEDKSVLIDCSSLRSGGGLQVALSFLSDLVLLGSSKDISVYISEEIQTILKEKDANFLNSFKSVRIKRSHIFIEIFKIVNWYRKFDLVFCLFGPAYFICKPKNLVNGFARPALIYPNIFQQKQKYVIIVNKFKNTVHKWLFRRSDELVTETEQVKYLIPRGLGFYKTLPISVVYNSLSKSFIRGEIDQTISVASYIDINVDIKLLYVGENYPHKNINILGQVFQTLKQNHGIEVRLFTTMKHAQFNQLRDDVKASSINLNYIAPNNLRMVMEQCDALIFPTLLECFSITPIEAMYSKLPLICSDRSFIREFCDDTPFYFDPLEVESIVNAIVDFSNSEKLVLEKKINKGRILAKEYSNSLDRTYKYLDIIKNQINKINP